MNKAELEDEIKKLEFIKEITNDKMLCIQHEYEQVKHDINNFKTQLAKLNKDKTGRVKIGDDVNPRELFLISPSGAVWDLSDGEFSDEALSDDDFVQATKQGRLFYDKPTAELFALREATEFKILCEFGDDVVIVYSQLKGFNSHHLDPFLRFCYDKEAVKYNDVCDFLDSLSPEELNSIRSE